MRGIHLFDLLLAVALLSLAIMVVLAVVARFGRHLRDILDLDSSGGTYYSPGNEVCYRARRYQLAAMALVTVALLSLAACQWIKVESTNQQSQGQTGPTNPQASPSPSVECALKSIAPGTVNDVTTIKQGATVGIGVTLFGDQGLELVPSCRTQYTPVWVSVAGPCRFAGGEAGTATAPANAVVGAACSGQVHVGNLTGNLELTVTAASAAIAPRGALGEPEPSPEPTPAADMGTVDR